MFFGALGEFAIGQVPAADAPLYQDNNAGPGALGQFALGQWGESITTAGVNVRPPVVAITVAFGAPTIASGANVLPPVMAVAVTFGAPEINARARRVKSQAIQS